MHQMEIAHPYSRVERSSNSSWIAYPLCKRRLAQALLKAGSFCAIGWLLIGCNPRPQPQVPVAAMSAIMAIDLSVPAQPIVLADGIHVHVAKNAWAQFVIRLDGSKCAANAMLRLPPMPAGISAEAFQVLAAPVDLNNAEYVRQNGGQGFPSTVPRVLLPLSMSEGAVDLSGLEDRTQPALIWIDLHIAPMTNAGNYSGNCELVHAYGTVPLQITVENLTLPNETHLHFAAPLDWATLSELYPETFDATPPRLLNRDDPRRVGLLRLVNDYIQLAHENKADFYMPRLQPIAKWPLGKMPQIYWRDYDSIVAPWLTGDGFADHQPVGFWPLPAPDALPGFSVESRAQYWQTAAKHFEQQKWLDRSPIVLASESGHRANDADAILMSAEAGQILAASEKVVVVLPLRDDQVQMVSASNSNAISSNSANRLLNIAPGLVYSASQPQTTAGHWINAAGDVSASAGEQGIRSLAWQAFSQNSSLILCDNALPSKDRPAPADRLVWAYPGQKYGLDEPLATLQLRWIRQAEQDYEYLLLSKQNNADTIKICELMAKPLHLQPDQPAQNLFDLFAGDTDPHDCESARQLLVDQLIHPATDQSVDPTQLQSVRWLAAREKQTPVCTGVDWMWDLKQGGIEANLHGDIYNTAHQMPDGGHLQWAGSAEGWDVSSLPTPTGAIGQYQVNRVITRAHFDPGRVSAESRRAMQFNFIDDFTRESTACNLVLPVALSQRRHKPLSLDGALDDWFPADAIHLNQPLVKMLDRPTVQAGTLQFSDSPTSIYTGWSDDSFYLGFRLAGVTAADLRSTRNFVQYDHGRAWGEDLCELLIQPIYIDNSTGPFLHIVCKPGGSWVEQQLDEKNWKPFEACGVRYASGVEPAEKVWRGEVAIPWKAINSAGLGRPGLLRFNFIQHQQATAESASWAGPIDESRDGKFTGLLLLKE